MAISVVYGRIGGIGLEWFLAELARCVGDSVSVVEDRRPDAPDAAEFEDVRQSRQGDSDAYRRLIERHQEQVGGILWRFSRDRIVHEELVQDVFVEAYMSLRSYRGKAPFEHWLSRIATRVGYRYWKQMVRRRETESFALEEWDQVADGPAEQMDPSEAASLIHRLLAQLPPRDRLVLTLRYLEECDVAETARRMGWTRGMVKVQALRAKKKLEKLIAKAERGLER
jgi:RNA polymerase sigma-70 factor (ECF subfamily)